MVAPMVMMPIVPNIEAMMPPFIDEKHPPKPPEGDSLLDEGGSLVGEELLDGSLEGTSLDDASLDCGSLDSGVLEDSSLDEGRLLEEDEGSSPPP